MHEARAKDLKRVGIVSMDPLRVLGLQSILEESARFEAIPLTHPNALKAPGLSIALIDESATEHLFELIAEFRRDRPNLRLVVLERMGDQEHIEQLIAAGARGYLTYAASENEIRMAIEAVEDGAVWASRKVLTRLLERPQRPPGLTATAPPKFTPREREVLRLLAMGYPNRNIGQELGVDEGTIKAHVGRLMRKVGVVNRTALTVTTLVQHFV